jgi:hypothetical protein
MQPLRLTVTNTTQFTACRPVRGGVPLPPGAVREAADLELRGADGQLVPCQQQALTTWPDGSARWVLLDFVASPPPQGDETYTLSLRSPGTGALLPPEPVQAGATSLQTGELTVAAGEETLLAIGDRARVQLLVTDAQGEEWAARAETVTVETAGPLRSTLCLQGSFRRADGESWFDFRLWVSVFAGLSRVLLEPLVVVNAAAGVVQQLRELRLVLEPAGGITQAALGGAGGWQGEPGEGVQLCQLDDQTCRLNLAAAVADRAPGWAEVQAPRPLAVALRDFWQQWPKALMVWGEALTVGLLPRFEAGACDHMGPWYKHDYLFSGDCYRLRTGQARRWQVWVDLAGDGPALAAAANAPLVPVADPRQALATGVWGPQMAAGTPGLEDYDRWADQLFEYYCLMLDEHRDYGALNWGDWWGERKTNWGNHEYDTPLHMLLQFARTGDPKYAYAGDIAARHLSEVDVVHAVNEDLNRYYEQEAGKPENTPSQPGMMHQHTIGHVGGFHPVARIRELYVELYRQAGRDNPSPYLCLDPCNLGHVFTQGLAYQYLLTGDPWTRETLQLIGGYLCGLVENQQYAFKGWDHCGRVNGWAMLALAGCHEVAPSPRYLAAMRSLAEDALEEQDPHCGGWLYSLPNGHCFCVTRKHVGEAGFITAVRLNGLSRYYELTGDERIPEAVRRGVTHLNNDTWRDEHSDWRYTSCPASQLMRQFGVIMMALRNSVALTGDPEHLRILRRAWAAKFTRLQDELAAIMAGQDVPDLAKESSGKEYGATAYGCGETMGLLASLEE